MKEQSKRFQLFLPVYFLIFLTAFGCTACRSGSGKPVSKSAFMLNTVVTVTLYDSADETVIDGALELCKNYENQLSMTLTDSEVSKMNHRLGGQSAFNVNEDFEELLEKAIYYSEITDGAFDITISPLSSLWDFSGSAPKVPSEDAIREILPMVDYKNLRLENHQLSFLSADTQLDFGAIAKGFIADKMKEYLIGQGVKSALINLGGNVLCIGTRPDQTPFKIGIQKPFKDRNEVVGSLNVSDMTVVSSGIYERNFTENGILYHHLLDPKTGYPFDNGLIAVTILCEKSVDGDGLSTSCFALGLEKGMELINSLENAYAVFITEEGTLFYSEGMEAFISE